MTFSSLHCTTLNEEEIKYHAVLNVLVYWTGYFIWICSKLFGSLFGLLSLTWRIIATSLIRNFYHMQVIKI